MSRFYQPRARFSRMSQNGWFNRFNPIAYIVANGHRMGSDIGTGHASNFQAVGMSMDRALARERAIIEKMADISPSAISPDDIARSRIDGLRVGLCEFGRDGVNKVKGEIAKVELAVEVAGTVAPGVSAVGRAAAKTSTVKGIKAAGKFDDVANSMDEALASIRKAMPDAVELPPAVPGQPYPSPPPGTKNWFQIHPPEPNVGNNLPHIKYADWTNGKKGTGGSWGHIFFPGE